MKKGRLGGADPVEVTIILILSRYLTKFPGHKKRQSVIWKPGFQKK
jgi:hypothetical protein